MQSIAPSILNGVSAILLTVALWYEVNRDHLLIWAGVTLAFAVGRVSLLLAFKFLTPLSDAVLKWEKPYTITLFMVFIIWGLGLPLIAGTETINSIPILTVTIFAIGIACSASSWYNGLRYVQIGAISICLLPMITLLLTHTNHELFWVGIAASFLFVTCITTSLVLAKSLDNKLELAYDLAKAKQDAEMIANTDSLTGLNNRRSFFDKTSALLAYCRSESLPISVIMFDVDFFKKINDINGHAAGDMTLQHVANLLQRHLRGSDISCRFGGEEFAILLPNTVDEEAAITAEKMRHVIEKTPVIIQGNKEVFITASFGVSDIGESMDDMLNNADEAMYRAKDSGRNNVKVYASRTNHKNNKIASNKSASVRTSLLNEV
ncbi:MAG: GGDEF domain-containing protein [Methylophilus sp.]|nr:GGDEF domain-containing protein [Methylophilus sp.]